jgi:hypothetical protein
MESVHGKVENMRQILFGAALIVLVALPLVATSPVRAQYTGQALILSSLEQYVPWRYLSTIESYLWSAGYNVTVLTDSEITVNFLTTKLNNYDVVIWRTNAYNWLHVNYWYVGELSNHATLTAYASDYQAGWLDNTNGILGISIDFISHHFGPGSLSHVKLMMMISSISIFVGQFLIKAGVKSFIDFYAGFSLQFDLIDYITAHIIRSLTSGKNVGDSVTNTVSGFMNMKLADSLDQTYVPPVWYMGDGTVTLT